MRVRRYIVRGVIVLAVLGIAYVGWTSLQLWLAWRSVDRVEFDLEASRAALDRARPEPGGEGAPIGIPDDAFDAYLLAGSDRGPELDAERADVILLFLWPKDGEQPALISIPRDLYVVSPCSGANERINASLDGCRGEINGAELLALTVEDLTGIEVDHFALFGMEGFVEVIDAVGGVTICVDHPFKQYLHEDALLPAGCSTADGETARKWVIARTPYELIDGEWRASDESGDVARNRRQRQLLLSLLSNLRGFRSPAALTGIVNDLSDAFIVDDDLDLDDAVSVAWDLRRLDPGHISQPTLATRPGADPDGEYVLELEEPFAETLLELFPEAAALRD